MKVLLHTAYDLTMHVRSFFLHMLQSFYALICTIYILVEEFDDGQKIESQNFSGCTLHNTSITLSPVFIYLAVLC